jgi:tetratricopeptide (TPR) repeat protein
LIGWKPGRKKSRFLFLHYYDPHYAYVPPEPFASKLEGNLYAGEIAYTDHCIGKIVDKLKELDLYDSTLIIVTGDHGEMLGEHGETTHGYYIYQSAIKVPLVIKLPGTHSARRVESLVGLVDLVPTICSLLGIEIPPDVQGEDLSAFLYGKATDETDRYIYCESMGPLVHGANSLLGIVDNRYKYIQTTRPELYDLVNDPGETKNLFESEYNRARIMQDALAQMIEQSARIDADDSKITLDRETLRRLESLGYTGGGGTDSFEFDQSRTDPKDLIAFAMLCEQGSMLGHKKKYDEAIAAFTEAIAMQPDHAKTYHSRAQIYLFTGDFEKVAMDLGKAIELNPDFTEAHNELGLLNVASGRHDQALGHFNRAIELDPGNAETYNHRGLIYFGKGDFAQAAADFSKSIEISPDDAQVYANRGWLSFRQGWIYRALDDLDQAILLDPQQVNAYTYRGMTLLSKGDFDRAFADFEQAILLNPQHAKAYEGRAFVYLRKGNRDLAIQNLMKYAELDPKNPAARRSLGQVLLAAGRVAEAVENYKSALQLQADWPDLLNALAWILATNKDPAIRDGSEAVRLAERACELENYQNPERILTLAAAHAEAGDFVEAIEAAEKAAQLTESARKRALHSQTLEHLELYRNGQPFRK